MTTNKNFSNMTLAELDAATDAYIEAGGNTGKDTFVSLKFWRDLRAAEAKAEERGLGDARCVRAVGIARCSAPALPGSDECGRH